MFPINKNMLDEAMASSGITDMTKATIRQICSLAALVEDKASDKFIHLEIGNPGLPAEIVGVEAECQALRSGVANEYPDIAGIPALKENGSRFVKAFLDVDINPEGLIPTVGSMQGSCTIMMLLKERDPKKDKMLFINPGFPAQRSQAKLVGLKEVSFDIYEYRGKKLEAKLEEMMAADDVTGILYSNPNNPAWTNLTEEELEIIGRVSKKHDVVVLEDLAYLGMDFRKDFSRPGEPPFVPTVAKYTDEYVLFLSASKIFSYAGQRIALVGISNALFNRQFEGLKDFFNIPGFGRAYVFGVLYAASSGTSHSAQYALAAMMKGAVEGTVNFVESCREYGRRGERVMKIFNDNGFNVVYAIDGDQPISNGFFFTAGYGDMTSGELQTELMRYGVSSISLPSTGSEQNGIRVCVSMISDDKDFDTLEERLRAFHKDHQ
ncbi:MAG: pyridoxal phosphate-dependent aminotransferase [Bacteroidales bacterium]|nr:pyridoxal phosphate-dependent aminotransferase [Bacteroidales bacterium]